MAVAVVVVEVVEVVVEVASTVGEVELSCLTGGDEEAKTSPKYLCPDKSSYLYRYGYAVQDDEGNDFNQQEQSDGEQVKKSDKYKQTKALNKQMHQTNK